MRIRRDLTRDELLRMPIAADPALEPVEKETCFSLLGGQKVLHVMSRHPTGVRGFLRQPEFVPTAAHIQTIRGTETLVGIDGDLPLASLHVGVPRKRKFLSSVFARRRQSRKTRDCASRTQSAMVGLPGLGALSREGAPGTPGDSHPSDSAV